MNDDLYSSWSIRIGGRFFDSFIYSGRLYLVTIDKKIKCLHWDRFINSLAKRNKDYSVGLHLAFSDSSALYRVGGKFLTMLSSDSDIGEALHEKILRGMTFEFESVYGINHVIQCLYEKEINLDTLPADILIYQKRIFLCSEQGFVEIPLKKRFPSKLSHRFWDDVVNVTDQPFVQLSSASYGYLLLSGLSDGVWQYALNDYGGEERLKQISPNHSSFTTRDYNDLLSGSYIAEAYLIRRNVQFADKEDVTEDDHRKRKTFIGERISLNKWFGVENGFFFSRSYLVYCIADGHIYSSNKSKIFSNDKSDPDSIKNYEISLPDKRVFEAQVEVFGLVVEYDDRLVVIFSDGHKEDLLFDGRKLTSWRSFPESKNYLNQLHLIFENEIEIHSFNGPSLAVHREFGFDYRYGDFE